jgi:cytoskeletal protein RodZ
MVNQRWIITSWQVKEEKEIKGVKVSVLIFVCNMLGWIVIIWFGILLVNVSRKKTQIELNDTSATSSDDFAANSNTARSPLSKEKRNFSVYDGDKKSKFGSGTITSSSSNLNIESVNRIFGASKTSFR